MFVAEDISQGGVGLTHGGDIEALAVVLGVPP